MTLIKSKALTIRKQLLSLMQFIEDNPKVEEHTFDFEFDGSTTVTTLPDGWVPFAVYLGVDRQRAGVGNDYTFSGNVITWDTAPLVTDYALIDARRVSK